MVITPSTAINPAAVGSTDGNIYTNVYGNPVPKQEITDKVGFVKAITNIIEPEEIEYVADIKEIIDDCEECGCDEKQCEDIVYVAKIIAFADKFRVLHWSAANHATHIIIDDFCNALEKYKDAVAENIQALIGQFNANNMVFRVIELPVGDNPLDIINQLKICVQNWFDLHTDDIEYEGCRNSTSEFLENIYKTVYLLRIAKNG